MSSAVRLGTRRTPRPRLALAAICMGFFMILLDGSALNVALPQVQRDMHGSLAAVQWVVNVYTVPLASLLLMAGSVADRAGAKRLFVYSLAGFTVASLVCAGSPTLAILVLARAIQGVAAAGVLPTTLTLIARMYVDPTARARAITLWGGTGGIALVAGPLGGGALSEAFGWRSIFLINIPFGVATVFLAHRYLSETPTRHAPSNDLAGQALVLLGLTSVVAALIQAGGSGWTAPVTVGLFAVAITSGLGFIAVERRTAHPMLPLRVFQSPPFTAAVLGGFAFQLGAYGLQFVLALYLQNRWRYSPIDTGLVFAPFALCWVLGNVVLNRRLLHRGTRWLITTGSAIAGAGALLLLVVDNPSTVPALLGATMLVGAGCGMLAPSLNGVAVTSIDPAYAGLGSAILNTSRQAGMAIGVALLGSLMAITPTINGLRGAITVIALSFAAILLLTLRYIPRNPPPLPPPMPSR